jgi:hypothetical protein
LYKYLAEKKEELKKISPATDWDSIIRKIKTDIVIVEDIEINDNDIGNPKI